MIKKIKFDGSEIEFLNNGFSFKEKIKDDKLCEKEFEDDI